MPVKITSDMVDLRQLGLGVLNEALAAAVDHAGKDMSGAIKVFTPTETGALRDSIDYKTMVYNKTNKVVVIVGVKSRFRKNGRRPSNYAHLVEFGHIAVKPVKGTAIRPRRGKQAAQKITYVAAKPFMRPGVETFKAFAASRLGSSVEKGMAAEVVRLRGKKREIIKL